MNDFQELALNLGFVTGWLEKAKRERDPEWDAVTRKAEVSDMDIDEFLEKARKLARVFYV